MKKIKYMLSITIFCTFLSSKAFAIFPDFTNSIPMMPEFCPQCLPPAIMNVTSVIAQVKEIKDDLVEETNITKLKQMLTSYAAQMGTTAFNSTIQNTFERKKIISSARTIKGVEQNDSELKDVNAVKDKFYKMFLQYPSNKENVRRAYKQKGEDLKVDTVIEMYMVANSMQEKLYGQQKNTDLPSGKLTEEELAKIGLLGQLELIESCLLKNENCEQIGLTSCLAKNASATGDTSSAENSKEDQVCFWNSALQAMRIYDTIMRYNETLAALQAQYRAVISIDKISHIKEFEEETPQTYLENKYRQGVDNYAVSELRSENSFASSDYAEDLQRYNESLATKENKIGGNFYSLQKDDGFESVLDNKDDDIASLELLDKAATNMNKAMAMHNLKQTLPNYRRAYQLHKKIKDYHAKAMNNLRISGECIQNFLSPYYSDTKKVWFGEKKCDYQRDDEQIKVAVEACKKSGSMQGRECENLLLRGNLYCHYTPERSLDDINMDENNKALYNIICPDDNKHICKVVEYNTEILDQGLSGYLMALYKEAKIQTALDTNETYIDTDNSVKSERSYTSDVKIDSNAIETENDDNYITPRDINVANETDEKHGGNMKLDQLKQFGEKRYNNDDSNSSKNQAATDAQADKTRADGLIFWQLGADTIKDIEVDLSGGNSNNSFGRKIKSFPLWNDQKEFYNQYIDGKYDNIELYIKNMTLGDALLGIAKGLNEIFPYEDDIDETGKVIKSKDEKRQEEADTIAANNIPKGDDLDKALDTMLQTEAMMFKKLEETHEKRLKSLKSQRNSLYQIKDKYSNELSQKNEAYNKNNEADIAAANNSSEAAFGTEYGKEIYRNRSTGGQSSVQDNNFQATQNNSKQIQEEARANKLSVSQTADLEKKISDTKEAIKQINQQIEDERKQFAKKYSDAEIAARKTFIDFALDYANNMPTKQVEKAITASPIIGYAARLMECTRRYATEQVEIAKQQIKELKQSGVIYYPSEFQKLHDIHNNMIDKITNITISDLSKSAGCNDILAELSALSLDLVGLKSVLNIFADICADDVCKVEDERYFVGIIARGKDFRAPKRPVDYVSAPLREVFHFDIIDFNNVEKDYEDIYNMSDAESLTTNTYSFLHGGFEVPEIWQYVLKHHAFVEKDIDFVRFFGNDEEVGLKGNPEKSYLRSGIYPCRLGNKIIDADMGGEQSFFLSILKDLSLSYTINVANDLNDYYDLPQCTSLQLYEDKIYDIEASAKARQLSPMELRGKVALSSELGHILTYIPENPMSLAAEKTFNQLPKAPIALKKQDLGRYKFSFNSVLLKAIQKNIDTENLGEDEESDAEFYLAKRTFLDRNQLGDFMNIVEMEQIAKDSLRNIESQLENIENDLGSILVDADFTISNDYDLLNEEDYKATAAALDGQKSYYIKKAEEYIQQVSGKSQTILDKLMQLKRQEEAMLIDSEEIIVLKGDEEKAELEEKIKTKLADRAIENEYNEESNKKDMTEVAPYCAVYKK